MPIGKDTIEDLIEEIYPDLCNIVDSSSERYIQRYFSQRVILAARNIDVDTVNNAVLHKLMSNQKLYMSADSAFNDAGAVNDAIPNEYLNTIVVSEMPLHETMLKLNCPIILLHNLNPYEGLCNNTRMIVTAMAKHVIEAQILTGTHVDEKAFIPRISLNTSISAGLGFILRDQLPI